MLSRFDTDIHYILGIANSAANALSQYLYIQNNLIEGQANAVSIVEFDKAILKSVKQSYKDDKLFGPVSASPRGYPLYMVAEGGLIFFEARLCIPSNDHTS